MIRISQIKLRPGPEEGTEEELRLRAAKILHVRQEEIRRLQIVKRSLDARKKTDIRYSYTVDVETGRDARILKKAACAQVSAAEADRYRFPEPGEKRLEGRPLIAGAGPAGLFCGYLLAEHGYRPLILERGKDVESRKSDVERFWRTGVLEPDSNVQFGEGGAGTFSDGKLNTLIKDRDGRGRKVLEVFVRCGAPENILYDAKPHIGTDILCRVVRNLRAEIEKMGGEVRFGTTVTDILAGDGEVRGVELNHRETIACRVLVLAVGHSARDTFEMLQERQVPMEAKAFAVGLRVEHPQPLINKSQYGEARPAFLPAAPYKVAARALDGRGVYSFCMCPGGYVVDASSEPGRLAVNGMSYSGRDGTNANSAVIVSVTPADFGGSHPLAGVAFQRCLEERAYALGQGKVPVQAYGDFKEKVAAGFSREGRKALESGGPLPADPGCVFGPCVKGRYAYADVSRILPEPLNRAFVEGMEQFGRLISGFNMPGALLSGVESRTSSPVRILRDGAGQSALAGLYPCGEGAGYAGGITSAAMDGILAAQKIAGIYAPPVGD